MPILWYRVLLCTISLPQWDNLLLYKPLCNTLNVITSATSQTWWGYGLVHVGDLFFSTELSPVLWRLWVPDDLSSARVLSGTVRLTLPSFRYTLKIPFFGSWFRLKHKQIKLRGNMHLNSSSYKKINWVHSCLCANVWQMISVSEKRSVDMKLQVRHTQ